LTPLKRRNEGFTSEVSVIHETNCVLGIRIVLDRPKEIRFALKSCPHPLVTYNMILFTENGSRGCHIIISVHDSVIDFTQVNGRKPICPDRISAAPSSVNRLCRPFTHNIFNITCIAVSCAFSRPSLRKYNTIFICITTALGWFREMPLSHLLIGRLMVNIFFISHAYIFLIFWRPIIVENETLVICKQGGGKLMKIVDGSELS